MDVQSILNSLENFCFLTQIFLQTNVRICGNMFYAS